VRRHRHVCLCRGFLAFALAYRALGCSGEVVAEPAAAAAVGSGGSAGHGGDSTASVTGGGGAAGDGGTPAFDGPYLVLGEAHSCARRSAGELYCWGYGLEGALGDGSGQNHLVPTKIENAGLVTEVALSAMDTCELRADGVVLCWGANEHGEVGSCTTADPYQTPAEVVGFSGSAVASVGMGGYHACALLASGAVACWGLNSVSQLGLGDVGWLESCEATPVPGLSGVAQLAVGYLHNCALRGEDATVWCWGDNQFGAIGLGTPSPSVKQPTLVPGLGDVERIWAGGTISCARRAGGELLCWGANQSGQLGIDTGGSPVLSPTTMPWADGLLELSLGGLHSCGRFADGTTRCWGDNESGELGIEGVASASSPTAVPELPEVAAVVAGWGNRTCATSLLGDTWCWGSNGYGQLGDGTTENQPTPTPIVIPGASQ